MNPKIMIVDDEQSIRDIISEFLTEMNYSVSIAVDGVDALEKLAYDKFDLFIVDVYMPRMDGLELLAKIRELQPLAVVIVTTGYSSVDIAIKAIRMGAYHYLTKPIQSEELLKAVKSGLKHGSDLGDNVASPVEDGARADKQSEIQLLANFTPSQAADFKGMGIYSEYQQGDTIPLDDETGSMIFVEGGAINVFYNNTIVDTLRERDVWGEEAFINLSSSFTTLKAQTDVRVRHFQRKKIMEFFMYNDDKLTLRYTINLIHYQYRKWKRSIYKIGIYSGFSSDVQIPTGEKV